MSIRAQVFAWMYFRAFVWILLATISLRRATADRKVSSAYFGAHMAALALGAVTDFILVNFASERYLKIDFL